MFGCFVLSSGVLSHVEPGYSDRARWPDDLHLIVQHHGGRIDRFATCFLCFGFKADAINRAIDFRNTQNLSNKLAQAIMLRKVDWLETYLLSMREPFLVHIADQHSGSAKNSRRSCCCEADRPRPGYIDGRSNADLGRHSAIEARGENFGQTS